MDEKTSILERLKQLGISAWCERGQVTIIPNKNIDNYNNLTLLNNRPVSR